MSENWIGREYRATHRFARISPRKVRPIARLVKGLRVDEALEMLDVMPQRGAKLLQRVIHSARANADDLGERKVSELYVKEVRVDDGPRLKRIQPRARGMAFLIRKRMCHIRVVLQHAID